MITTRITTPFVKYLSSLKVYGRQLFSNDEILYLYDANTAREVYDFKQEGETDDEFLRLFSTWLHERPKQQGYVEYYVLVFMRQNELLTASQFEFLERNVTECFDTSHGWLYEINHRLRFRLHIQLICTYPKSFYRLVRKDWRNCPHINPNNNISL